MYALLCMHRTLFAVPRCFVQLAHIVPTGGKQGAEAGNVSAADGEVVCQCSGHDHGGHTRRRAVDVHGHGRQPCSVTPVNRDALQTFRGAVAD